MTTAPTPSFGPNGEVYGPDGTTPITNPDGTPFTIPAAMRDQLEQAGQNGDGSIDSLVIPPVGAPTTAASLTTTTHG